MSDSEPAALEDQAPEGSRAVRRAHRAALVEKVALQLFTERGLDDVTAEEIASSVGISRRTFFRYFPGGKEEVVLADYRRRMQTIEEAMANRPPHEPAFDALRASVKAMASDYEDDREAALIWARIIEGSPTLAARAMGEQLRLQDSLVHMVAMRLAADPATDPRPGVLVAATLAATNVALTTWLLGGEHRPFEEFVDEALDVLAVGFLDTSVRRIS